MPDLLTNFLIHWRLSEIQLEEVINRGMKRKHPDAGRQLLVMLENDEVRLPVEQRRRMREAGILVVLVPAKLKSAESHSVALQLELRSIAQHLELRRQGLRAASPALRPVVVENSTIDNYAPLVPVSDRELEEILEQSNSTDYSTTNGV